MLNKKLIILINIFLFFNIYSKNNTFKNSIKFKDIIENKIFSLNINYDVDNIQIQIDYTNPNENITVQTKHARSVQIENEFENLYLEIIIASDLSTKFYSDKGTIEKKGGEKRLSSGAYEYNWIEYINFPINIMYSQNCSILGKIVKNAESGKQNVRCPESQPTLIKEDKKETTIKNFKPHLLGATLILGTWIYLYLSLNNAPQKIIFPPNLPQK